jgi:hypothetical protein
VSVGLTSRFRGLAGPRRRAPRIVVDADFLVLLQEHQTVVWRPRPKSLTGGPEAYASGRIAWRLTTNRGACGLTSDPPGEGRADLEASATGLSPHESLQPLNWFLKRNNGEPHIASMDALNAAGDAGAPRGGSPLSIRHVYPLSPLCFTGTFPHNGLPPLGGGVPVPLSHEFSLSEPT